MAAVRVLKYTLIDGAVYQGKVGATIVENIDRQARQGGRIVGRYLGGLIRLVTLGSS